MAGEILTLQHLKILMQRDSSCLRVFSADGAAEPIGLVALSGINPRFRSATLWYVGDRAYAGRGFTTRAVGSLLGVGFDQMDLFVIQAWTVEGNVGSIRVLERNGFRFTGRQRGCHVIDGDTRDRLLFDLLRSEYQAGRDAYGWRISA